MSEPPSASTKLFHLASLPARELEELLREGEAPDRQTLAGSEYRGVNTPTWTRVAGIRKFIKGFYLADDGERILGYNIRVRQGSLQEPWSRLPGEDSPRRFAFFAVDRVDPRSRDHAYPNALLLDYSHGRRTAGLSRLLRDYLVRIEPGSDTLLLGKAYLAVAGFGIPVSFFILDRLGDRSGADSSTATD
jgi:hypothetical protein